MGLTRACGWLALSSLIAAEAQTAATTTQTSAASATFAYVSDDGCIQNEVVVFANTTTVVSGKTPGTTSEVSYTRHRYDHCEDSDLGTDLGTGTRPTFSGDLNKASLNAAVAGRTPSGSTVTFSVALVWEGKGGITHQAGRPQKAGANGAKSIRSENLGRNAVVNGTIDGEEISDAVVGGSLHTTRKTIAR
jgi:hypothetical protein